MGICIIGLLLRVPMSMTNSWLNSSVVIVSIMNAYVYEYIIEV